MFRLASVLLLLLFTYNQFLAQAADASSITSREEAPSSSVDCSSQRTLFNIVWGCISTTIICAWAALHPNIPPREGPFKATLRRLELMLWTIVAPEILPAWALNQRLAAMKIRDLYNEKKGYKKETCGIWKRVKRWFSLDEMKETESQAWTLKHGHFLIMGGFHLVEPVEENPEATPVTEKSEVVLSTSTPSVETPNADAEKGSAPPSSKPRVTILTLEMLEELVKAKDIEIQVTEDEITNRSKGDALSKTIFILQSSSFIMQCIARRIQGLSFTQLELTTLALASLNGITFILWWDKPLGAQTLLRVYLKRKLTDAERNVAGRRQSARSDVLVPTLRAALTAIRDIILGRSVSFTAWLVQLPLAIVALLLFPMFAFTFALYATITDLVLGESTSFPDNATHVPTFHVPHHEYHNSHALLLIALGSMFGAIHCAGWNLIFPTYAEQKLWRVASLAVTIAPIAAFPFAYIAPIIGPILKCLFAIEPNDGIIAAIIAILFILMCASARLILLGLALALLRHQPPSAFIAVDWTKFYPHIF